MNRTIIWMFGLLLWVWNLGGFSLAGPSGEASARESLGLPAPRAYQNPRITTVDQLMPAARAVITRPERSVQWPGLSIKGGEKVLMVIDTRTDPLVVDAFLRALREKNCRVDLLVEDSGRASRSVEDFILNMNRSFVAGVPLWMEEARKAYDIVFGKTFNDWDRMIALYYGSRLEYTNREKLGSPAVTYPDEILDLIERKAWNLVKSARNVRITDPQGTDVSFTWHDEWWEIIEGTHPTIKIPGISRNHVYRREASAVPMISGHIDVHPRSGIIDKADFTGVVAGTISDAGPIPLIKVHYKNNRITRIEGGGAFGRGWQKALEETKHIQYPYYPKPGTAWMCEISMGTHPKYRGIINDPALKGITRSAGWSWTDARMRSGVLHFAHGAYDAIPRATQKGHPINHFHVYPFFATYTITTKDGRTVDLIKNGRLIVLDDPEVRKVAAKFGNPDELLAEDWTPVFNPVTKELEIPPGPESANPGK
ncbi:MAG: hypothetical protein HY645_05865 [Acidobacteria bacterium]|nr:hypothetical protein [Acidobacteriota bacterium]